MTAPTSITIRVPLRIRRRPGRKTVFTPVASEGCDKAVPTRTDPTLMKALARAFRYQKLLDEGRYSSLTELSAAEKVDRGYLGRLLRLTLFAPDIVETMLGGGQMVDTDLSKLLEAAPFEWLNQRKIFAVFWHD